MKNNSRNDNEENSENENEGGEMNEELHELFLNELADLLDAEKQLTKALPKMIKAAESDELRSAITAHLEETEGHIRRLEEIAANLDEKLKRKKCAAMA